MNDLFWEHTDSPLDADLLLIDAGLEESNYAAVDLNAVRPLACFARLPSGGLIGGALARSWGECCELRQIWVTPQYRRRGIGRRLVEMVEAEARYRGCKLIYLETFSFQTPQLYRALGFNIACEFQGFPQGVVKYMMRKSLHD